MSKIHGESAWWNYYESFRHLIENVNLIWQKPVKKLRIREIAANFLVSKTTIQPFVTRLFLNSVLPLTKVKSASSFPVTSSIHVEEIIPELSVKLTGSQIKTNGLSTAVQVEPIRHEIQGLSFSKYLPDGFSYGFCLGCVAPLLNS